MRMIAASSPSSVSLEMNGHAYTATINAVGRRFPQVAIVEDGLPAGAVAYDPATTTPLLGWVPDAKYTGPLTCESERARVVGDLTALLSATGKARVLGLSGPAHAS